MQIEEKYIEMTDGLSRYDLEELEKAIKIQRNRIYAEKLRKAGFKAEWVTICEIHGDIYHSYIEVYDPNFDADDYMDTPEMLRLTITEARQMLDTVANVTPKETFKRMKKKAMYS